MAVLKESISTSTAAPIPADVDPSSVSFDKNTFCRKLNITALSVPAQLCSTLIEKLRGRLIGGRKLRCVVDDPQKRKDRKLILLDVGITMDNLPQSAKAILNAQGAAIEVVHDYPVTVDHSHFSVGFAFVVAIFYMATDYILRQILPPTITEIPSAFETIGFQAQRFTHRLTLPGHIAHVNLKDEHLPYRKTIGAVILAVYSQFALF